MRLPIAILTTLFMSGLAAAQDGAPIEVEVDLTAATVIAAFDADAGVEDQSVLGELSLDADAEKVLDNGVRLRGRMALRLQRDNPARPDGTGGFGSGPAATGAFSGLSAGTPIEDSDTRVRFETAYFQIDGGYGELRLGRDLGVAARFHEGSDNVLDYARLDTALLDPSGLSTLRTRHDLTGPSLKVSYATPRILGVRAGISLTPEADADGLDRRPGAGTGGPSPDTTNAVEIALNATRRLRESGLRIDAALAWSSADVSSAAAPDLYGRADTVSAGLKLEKDDWTFGGSWLSSDNGLSSADYDAWNIGLSREFETYDVSLNYGESVDDGAALASKGWQLGAARAFGKDTRLALSYSDEQLETPNGRLDSRGVVVEITLSTELLNMSGN